jgi:alpha-aminoadipate carrier protein LysW
MKKAQEILVSVPTGRNYNMSAVKCPVCDADVNAEPSVMLGELLSCKDCGTELEVTSLNPLAVEEAPEVQEDWGE